MFFGEKLRLLREQNNLTQRLIASSLDIDTATYCKIEKGDRRAKRDQVLVLSKLLKTDKKELLNLWAADKVYEFIANENDAENILKIVAESIAEYGKKKI